MCEGVWAVLSWLICYKHMLLATDTPDGIKQPTCSFKPSISFVVLVQLYFPEGLFIAQHF